MNKSIISEWFRNK